jgi:hypothetical protein
MNLSVMEMDIASKFQKVQCAFCLVNCAFSYLDQVTLMTTIIPRDKFYQSGVGEEVYLSTLRNSYKNSKQVLIYYYK